MRRISVKGSPEMIVSFFDGLQSYSGGNRRFLPAVIQIQEEFSEEADGKREITSELIMVPPRNMSRAEIVDFFVDFLEVVNLIAKKNDQPPKEQLLLVVI